MLTAVTDLVLPALFLFSGIFALTALAMCWQEYGARFRSIRADLAALEDIREFMVRMSTVEVREVVPLVSGRRVRPQERPVPARKRPALRAAA